MKPKLPCKYLDFIIFMILSSTISEEAIILNISMRITNYVLSFYVKEQTVNCMYTNKGSEVK